jgi:tRNA-binding protein
MTERGAAMAGDGESITFDDFLRVEVCAGTIVEAEPYPEARRPAYKLRVDFGPEIGIKKTSVQITEHYAIEQLPGRQVAAVVNFPPKQIGKFMSEVLVLGFPDEAGAVVLIAPDKPVPNGARMF